MVPAGPLRLALQPAEASADDPAGTLSCTAAYTTMPIISSPIRMASNSCSDLIETAIARRVAWGPLRMSGSKFGVQWIYTARTYLDQYVAGNSSGFPPPPLGIICEFYNKNFIDVSSRKSPPPGTVLAVSPTITAVNGNERVRHVKAGMPCSGLLNGRESAPPDGPS